MGNPFILIGLVIPSTLNESFWAGLFAEENFVIWEPAERAFYRYRDEIGIYEVESVDAIKRQLSDRCWRRLGRWIVSGCRNSALTID